MAFRFLAITALSLLCGIAIADELDTPPAPDQDPYCLKMHAAREAYLSGKSDVPVSDAQLCPPDAEKLRQREFACRAAKGAFVPWQFISDGFESGSSMLSKGVPYVVDVLGQPLAEEQLELGWDIDIYEIQRRLYFQNVTVVTRDFIRDAINFDATSGTVTPTDVIYEMLIERGDFRFAHGLTLSSSREEVEAALGLPCQAVAHSGRAAVRKTRTYVYSDNTDQQKARYSVTFRFDDGDQIDSVHWYFDSVWH